MYKISLMLIQSDISHLSCSVALWFLLSLIVLDSFITDDNIHFCTFTFSLLTSRAMTQFFFFFLILILIKSNDSIWLTILTEMAIRH